MVDIYQLPPNVIIDPIMDMNLILPLWLWILLGLFLVCIISLAFWLMRFFVLRPVMGAASTANSGSATKKLVFFFEKTRSFRIDTLECSDDVLAFADTSKIPRWLITSPLAVGRINFSPVMICSSSYDSTRDPTAELAVLKICNEFNSSRKSDQQGITCYDDFMELAGILKTQFPEGVDIPSFSLYRPEAIAEYTPQSRSAALFGGMLLRDARKLNLSASTDSGLSRFIPLILFAGVGIISICVVFMIVTGKGL